MKQLLFLLLFPCLALAQYTGNGNQKITLGEQTTADGLIWRGVASDTTLTAKSDTAAYFVLDTVNKKLYFYKASAIPKWNEISGSGGGGGTGTVTSITGGTGLTGGTITTSGTLAADTTFLFTQSDTLSLNLANRFGLKLNITDTTAMLLPYFRDADTSTLNLTSRFATKQNNITLTTTGTSGAATLTGATLNIPQYSGGGGISDGDKGDIDVTNSGATWTIDTSAISLSGNKVTGTLPVANGGTGSATQNFVDLTTAQSVGGAKTFTSAVTATRFNPTASTATGTGMFLPAANELGFSVLDSTRFFIKPFNTTLQVGNTLIGVNTTSPSVLGGGYSSIDVRGTGGGGFILGSKSNAQAFMYSSPAQTIFQTLNSAAFSILIIDTVGVDAERYAFNANRLGQVGIAGISVAAISEALHVNGNARITAMNGINDIGASATGVLQAATSDMNLKNTIEDSPFGLNEILLLNPVTFLYNDENRKIDSDVKEVGFIAQDVFDIIPNAVSSTGTGDLQLDYRAITATLVKAIQEQQALIKELEQRIINLENK